MKKITLFSFIFVGMLSFSQQQQYQLGFEPSTPSGDITNWVSFENPDPSISIVTNPDPDGVNTSSSTKVMKVDFVQASACYAGIINDHGALGTWRFDTAIPSNVTVSMQVNKSIAGKVGIKFVTPSNGTVIELTTNEGSVSTLNEWVTLSWNISSLNTVEQASPRSNDQFVIFADFTCGGTDRTSGGTLLIDNITWTATKLTDPATCTDGVQNGTETGIDCGGNCSACPSSTPLVAAPTPTIPAANVISMFSNAYTNVGVNTWRTSWSNGVLTDLQIAGNDTKKYENLSFVGTETTGANLINASSMMYFHIDAWTPNMTQLKVKIVDFGANAAYGGGDDTEHELLYTPVQGSWNSYHIPLSDFTGLTNRSKIAQLILSSVPAGTGTLFFDNVYFSSVNLNSTSFINDAKVKLYPNPTSNILNIEAAAAIQSLSIVNILGQEVISRTATENMVSLDVSNLQSGIYVVKTTIDGVVSSTKFIKE